MHYPAAHALISCGNWENRVAICQHGNMKHEKEASFHLYASSSHSHTSYFPFLPSWLSSFWKISFRILFIWFMGESLGTSFFFFCGLRMSLFFPYSFLFLIFKFILVALYGMWDASSPIRGQIHAHALQGYGTTRGVPFLYYWIIVYKHIEFCNYFS